MADSKVLEGLKARWERLTERERLLIAGFGVAACLVVAAAAALYTATSLGELESENHAIRQALKDVEEHRDSFIRARNKAADLEKRIGGNVQLEGFLEQAANQSDVVIRETTELKAMPLKNSKYLERAVEVHLQKCTLDQLARFMKKIETGPNLIVVTGLHTKVRDDKHEDLDVDMTVSTWERAPDKQPGKKPGAGDTGAKEGKG